MLEVSYCLLWVPVSNNIYVRKVDEETDMDLMLVLSEKSFPSNFGVVNTHVSYHANL